MTTQTGPRLTITGTCEGCARLRSTPGFAHDCTHDDAGGGSTVLGPIPRKIGRKPTTPAWCPLLPDARLALLVDLARTLCRKCGRTVEPERECYAIPTCFACLPPPPPMTVHPGFAAWQKRQEAEAAVPMAIEEEPSR